MYLRHINPPATYSGCQNKKNGAFADDHASAGEGPVRVIPTPDAHPRETVRSDRSQGITNIRTCLAYRVVELYRSSTDGALDVPMSSTGWRFIPTGRPSERAGNCERTQSENRRAIVTPAQLVSTASISWGGDANGLASERNSVCKYACTMVSASSVRAACRTSAEITSAGSGR